MREAATLTWEILGQQPNSQILSIPPPHPPLPPIWFISSFMQKESKLMDGGYYASISSISSGHSRPTVQPSILLSVCYSSRPIEADKHSNTKTSQNCQINPTWGRRVVGGCVNSIKGEEFSLCHPPWSISPPAICENLSYLSMSREGLTRRVIDDAPVWPIYRTISSSGRSVSHWTLPAACTVGSDELCVCLSCFAKPKCVSLLLRLSTGEGDGAWCPAGAVYPSGSEYLQVGSPLLFAALKVLKSHLTQNLTFHWLLLC